MLEECKFRPRRVSWSKKDLCDDQSWKGVITARKVSQSELEGTLLRTGRVRWSELEVWWVELEGRSWLVRARELVVRVVQSWKGVLVGVG